MRTGYMQNWNLILERQFFNDTVIRAGYVGSKGTSMMNTIEVNPGIYGPGATASNIDQRRPYQPIGGLQLALPAGFSNYHALQLTFEKRFSRSYSVLANYTMSKSIDNTSYSAGGGNSGGPDPFHFDYNRGLSDFDIPQRLVVSGIVELPKFSKRNVLLKSAARRMAEQFHLRGSKRHPADCLKRRRQCTDGCGWQLGGFDRRRLAASGRTLQAAGNPAVVQSGCLQAKCHRHGWRRPPQSASWPRPLERGLLSV